MDHEIRSSLIRVLPFLVVLLVVCLRIKQKKLDPLELALIKPFSWARYVLCVLGFFLFAVGIELLLHQMGILEIDKWNKSISPSIIRIAGAVVLAPAMEEIVFRGIIFNLLRKRLNVHLSVLIQALIFVVLHNFTWENTLTSNIGVVQSLIDASLFAYARLYTRSIYTPMTMHATGNLIATVERFMI